MQLVVHLSPDDDADVVSGLLWWAGAAGIEERPGLLIATFGSGELAAAAHGQLTDLAAELRDPPPAADTERGVHSPNRSGSPPTPWWCQRGGTVWSPMRS